MRLFSLPFRAQLHAIPLQRGTVSAPQRFARVLEETLSASESSLRGTARYVVKSGDTLSGIALAIKRQTRVSDSVAELVDRLAAVNRLRDPDVLQAGQTLDLPVNMAASSQSAGVPCASSQEANFFVDTYGRMVMRTARKLAADPVLSLAVARAESGLSAATAPEVRLDPRAVSKDGKSMGLFQLTAETARAQLQRAALHQTYRPFDPQQNARLGVGYLKYLFAVFSQKTFLQEDLQTTAGADPHEARLLAVAAYNAGEGRVARAQAQARTRGGDPARYQDVAPYLPATTRRYVERVEHFAAQLRTEAYRGKGNGPPE